MYSTRSGIILGFHGCDESVVEKVINGKEALNQSENSYDWLGHGIYFWENSPSRALEFAERLMQHPKNKTARNPIRKPAVVGAIIHPGHCLDLMDYGNLALLKSTYEFLKATQTFSGLPQNK